MHVTKIPWVTKVQGSQYGAEDTYRMAADWLSPYCETIADWGGAQGHFGNFLPSKLLWRYHVVDGTLQTKNQVIADLATYHERSEGILLRHVLEMSDDWKVILENAVEAFTKRMVLVTFTKQVESARIITHHLTWPVYAFNHEKDLIPIMRPYLAEYTEINTGKHLEHVYFLEKT